MPLDIVQPPTIHELMVDPIYKKMVRTRPRIPANLDLPTLSPMWTVWAITTDGVWRRAKRRTYDDAYRLMKDKLLPDEHILDVAVTNIRFMMPPPSGFKWNHRTYPWCARCRRPSLFQPAWTHRAVESPEILDEEPTRCWYCGIRSVALPRYSPRP